MRRHSRSSQGRGWAAALLAGTLVLRLPATAVAAESLPPPASVPSPNAPSHRSYHVAVVKIPMRDGTDLVADLVTPGDGRAAPVVVAISPYGRHALYPIATLYSQAGLAFLGVDLRGRGDSGGTFRMFYSDLTDTPDVIAWAAEQSFSNGKVAMWGASYGGYNQWMAAAKRTPGLVTIVPGAAVMPGRDFPMALNIGYPYSATWTGFTLGRMANFPLFSDQKFWREAFTQALASGAPFKSFDQVVGFDSDLFDEWVAHPSRDAYWQAINPSAAEMAAIDLPILTVTGLYDGAQLGALAYYRQHMAGAPAAARARHFLVIGPYDHSGVGSPAPTVGGLAVPNRGGMEPVQLEAQWYNWTMAGGARPAFLRDRVMYYVMGANEWRSAASLEAIPVEPTTFNLAATTAAGAATALARAGTLQLDKTGSSAVSYRFDPRDLSKAGLGSWFEGAFALHDADVKALDGDGLVFETAPFATPVEVIGAPRFTALISIDTPDADFRLRVFEVRPDGSSVYLSESRQRARYRHSDRTAELVTSTKPERYVFEDFSFASRRLDAGSKLRFVFDPPNSIYVQRNYNAARDVADQTPQDARTVTVRMVLGGRNGAKLTIPMRKPEVAPTPQ